ncbi:MAG: sulfatase-like hydrolase/transferase, partial [Clostridia bacterium]|nr:sulfatase-like hydrolase/transferase [Clostridia bacterium]
CVPARACLALGQGYERCGTWNNDLCCPLDRPTVYSVLRDGGYEVSGVGKFDLHKPIMHWGGNGWIPHLSKLGFTRGLENEGKGDAVWAFGQGQSGPYAAYMDGKGLMESYAEDHLRRAQDPLDAQASDIAEEDYADNWVTENARAQLRELSKTGAPWFLTVNFSGPHDPWDVTPRMKREWEHTDIPLPEGGALDRRRLLAVRQNYAAMLENIDRNIGILIEDLKELGQYEDTVIIYSADHGEMLGDRDRFFKSVPYRPSVHIPLVISGADVLKGHVCHELVQLHDLAATVTDFCGLSMPADTDARSLRPLATTPDAPPVRDWQYAALYPHIREKDGPIPGYEDLDRYRQRHFAKGIGWRSFTTKEYKYVEYLDGRKELFDLRSDPDETTNIAHLHPDLTARFYRLTARQRTTV